MYAEYKVNKYEHSVYVNITEMLFVLDCQPAKKLKLFVIIVLLYLLLYCFWIMLL